MDQSAQIQFTVSKSTKGESFEKANPQLSTKSKFQCQIYLSFGHTTNKCWKRFNTKWKTPFVHQALSSLQISDIDVNG